MQNTNHARFLSLLKLTTYKNEDISRISHWQNWSQTPVHGQSENLM